MPLALGATEADVGPALWTGGGEGAAVAADDGIDGAAGSGLRKTAGGTAVASLGAADATGAADFTP